MADKIVLSFLLDQCLTCLCKEKLFKAASLQNNFLLQKVQNIA